MATERRLLVVTESIGIGGTESHLIRLLPALSALGWSIVVFCLAARGEYADQLQAAGIPVLSSPWNRSTGARRNPAQVLLAASRLFGLMRRWRPHIAHFYLPAAYLIGAPLAIAAGTPIKVMSRRSLSRYQNDWPLVGRVERALHRRMNAVIGNSQAVVNELISEEIPECKVRLIYNGIKTSLTIPDRIEARQSLGIGPDTLLGVVVANLIPYKGHKDLIEGLSTVSQELPSGWRVLCAGRDCGLRSKLEGLAETYGIKANLGFIGERGDIPRLLAAADFGVLCSHEEGFPNVVLEAMAAGLPMIVTAVGGSPEAVLDHETGLVVAPRDPPALGNGILRLARDPKLRWRLGRAARHRVQQEFSLESCVRAHHGLYDELLAKAD